MRLACISSNYAHEYLRVGEDMIMESVCRFCKVTIYAAFYFEDLESLEQSRPCNTKWHDSIFPNIFLYHLVLWGLVCVIHFWPAKPIPAVVSCIHVYADYRFRVRWTCS
jgi:hypothetical protein